MNIKKIAILSILSLFLFQGFTFADDKIAVIDIQKVVSSSAQVKALKSTQETKQKELEKFIKNAKANIDKQKTEEAKKKLAQKYENDLVTKRKTISSEYTSRLKEIDKSISAQIGKIASDLGYTIVIPKATVIWGGNDITEDVIKVIK